MCFNKVIAHKTLLNLPKNWSNISIPTMQNQTRSV